jgi:hypothetical protein
MGYQLIVTTGPWERQTPSLPLPGDTKVKPSLHNRQLFLQPPLPQMSPEEVVYQRTAAAGESPLSFLSLCPSFLSFHISTRSWRAIGVIFFWPDLVLALRCGMQLLCSRSFQDLFPVNMADCVGAQSDWPYDLALAFGRYLVVDALNPGALGRRRSCCWWRRAIGGS